MTIDDERVAFLRQLSERHPEFLVWKHLDRALQGRGDVDAAAPPRGVEEVATDAVGLAAETLGASHVIRCDHVADKCLHFFVQPARLPQLFELDLSMQPSRGLAPWAPPHRMAALADVRQDGIRCLRPGAEAVVSIVFHGLSVSGRYRLKDDERKIVEEGLRLDLDGALAACGTLPPRPARLPLRRLVRTAARGGWSAWSARLAFAAFVVSSAAHPGFYLRRVRFRRAMAGGTDCVMSRLARHNGRQVPDGGLESLLRTARGDGHAVVQI